MARDLYYGDEARRKLQAGVDKLADAVKITLGPKGRNAVIEKTAGVPYITNDGVSITRNIKLPDIAEDLGAQLIREVATKANDAAGDGTTTATLLAQVIIGEGMKNAAAGANAILLRKGIQGAVDVAVKYLQENARKVETKEAMAQVAAISGADEKTGEMIAEAMERTGNGVITIEESKTMETVLDIVEGTQFDKGYLSEHMVTDQDKMEAVLDRPYILFTDKKFSNMQDLFPILEKVHGTGRALLIVAEDVEGDALKALVINKLKGVLNVVAVKAPGFGERKKALVDDLALLTGATVVREETGFDIREATLDMLGEAEKVTVKKDRTIIVNGAGDREAVKGRIEMLRRMLAKAENEFDVDKASERLGKLYGAVAVIRVGAVSELEMKENKLRIEDALNATRAAVEEGIVPGGGVALCNAVPSVAEYAKGLEGDVKTGARIILGALEAPLKQIAENAGCDGEVVVGEIRRREPGIGYNAASEEYVPMIEAGIIDPVKVTRSALQSAASVAATFLTTEADVIDPVDEAYSAAKYAKQQKEKAEKAQKAKEDRIARKEHRSR